MKLVSKKNLVSTFYYFLKFYKDAQTTVIWLDNCSGQNKNLSTDFKSWLFIHKKYIATETIILNYFEAAHTFM